MKIFLLILFSMLICDYSWAQKTEEFDVTFEQDITVQGKIEAVSTTESSKPCPAMTEVQRDAIVSPANGSCVYNTTTSLLNVYNGSLWKSAGGGGISPWASAFNYVENDVVIQADKIYQCLTAHTSTIFVSDIANWKLISDNLPIDLSAHVTGVLPMANGGTDKNLTPVLGGLVYTDDLSMEVLAAGTSGQVLKSNGAAAPTWEDASNKVQGQSQTEVDFTKLEFPNQSVTQTATDVQLVYDSGLIFDGGFESATAFQGHTIVNGATYFAVVNTAGNVLDGKKTARVTCFNAAPSGVCKIEQTVNLGTTRLQGFPMLLSVRVDSVPEQPLTFCAKIDGVEKDCVTGYKGYLTIPTQAGSTSVGYTLSKNEYVTPLNSFFDSIKVEITETVTNAPVIEVQSSRRDFGTSATPITITGSLNQTSGQGIYSYNSGTGVYTVLKDAIFNISASSSASITQTNISINISGQTSLRDSSNYDASTSSWTGRLTSGQTFSVSLTGGGTSAGATVSVVGTFTGAVSTYSDRCRDTRNCETVFSGSSTGSTTPGVASENLDWISSITRNTTGDYTFNLNSGIFSVAPECSCTVVDPLTGAKSNGCYIVSVSTTSVRTNTVQGGVGSVDLGRNIICQRQGQDYINAKISNIIGSFKGYSRHQSTAWSSPSRAFGTSYQNTNPNLERNVRVSGQSGSGEIVWAEVSDNGSTWTNIGRYGNATGAAEVTWTAELTIPPLVYYRMRENSGSSVLNMWVESE